MLAALRWDQSDPHDRYPVHVAYAGNHHPILVARTRERLADLSYDFPMLAELCTRREWTTVNLLWPESPTTFHARNPFPPGGVIEDPATGAAAAAFGGYLRTVGLATAPSSLTVFQGEDMGQPSRLGITLSVGEPGVLVSGTAHLITG